MSANDVALMAHLMRRAGFGTTRTELEAYVEKGYENVVDDLVHPERGTPIDEDILERYFGSEGAYVGILDLSDAEQQMSTSREDGTLLASCLCDGVRQESAHPRIHEPD